MNKTTLKEQVLEALKLCYDPEIPINVVDLGLIYKIDAKMLPNKRKNAKKHYEVNILMTLTTPGCAMADFIVEEVRNRALTVSGVKSATVELVFDPPWDRSKISQEAKLELGIL